MFGIDFRSFSMPRSWETAHRMFNERAAVGRGGGQWKSNERPLRDDRAHHLRIVKRNDESYDLMLYRHTMIRFHKPTLHKCEVDVFMPWGGKSNWGFIWEAGYGWGTKLDALRFKEPVWLHPYPSSEPDGQSAHLVFKRKTQREHWLLDTTQSWQLQAYRYVYVGDKRKKDIERIKERMQSLTLLLYIAQQDYTPDYDTDYTKLFLQGNEYLRPARQLGGQAVLDTLQQYAAGTCDSLTEAASAGLVAWFKRTLDVRYSKDSSTTATWKMDDKSIEDALVRLLRSNTNEARYERLKVPVKMWRSGGNRPSRTRLFQTRAEALRAHEKYNEYLTKQSEL